MRAWLGAVAAGAVVQLRQTRGNPDWLLPLVVTPLTTAVFVVIFLHAGRHDLAPYGVLAPALVALWQMSLLTAGELITRDRDNGSLEALLATPAPFAALLTGRVLVVVAVSLLAFPEAWIVGALLTGAPVAVAHPFVFAVVLVLTALAMTGWAGVMASVFVLARSARTFQNSLSYPFYVLGGVLVPVSLLPAWVEWPSRLVFLSWSSDLLRAALSPGAVGDLGLRLAAVAGLGAAGFVLAHVLLGRALRRVRTTGSLAHA